MDESTLFPGFGRPDDDDRTARRKRAPRAKATGRTKHAAATDAAGGTAPDAARQASAEAFAPPPPGPDDCVPAAPFVPAALLDHAHLGSPTLHHLKECPALGITASAVLEECLRTRRRFPHTLLVGPADSSKRTIARAIADEMAVPFHAFEFMHLRGPRGLHAALGGVPAGAVVLLSGLEAACPEALGDLALAVQERRRPRIPQSFESMIRGMDAEAWKRGQRRPPARYADFTVILTSREHVPSGSSLHRWVELQYFLQRNAETESARLRRLFRHAGIALDDDTVQAIAETAVESRIRTLQVANLMAAFIRRAGSPPADVVREIDGIAQHPEGGLRRLVGLLLADCRDPGK